MSEVKRYDIETDGFDNFSIVPDKNGRYVTFEDYAALKQRAEAAEAKLAELGASVPVYQYESAIYNEENGDTDWYWDDCDKGFYDQYDPSRRRILFTRAAPAADLAELVPGIMETPTATITYSRGLADGWNDCRTLILRNIEEAK